MSRLSGTWRCSTVWVLAGYLLKYMDLVKIKKKFSMVSKFVSYILIFLHCLTALTWRICRLHHLKKTKNKVKHKKRWSWIRLFFIKNELVPDRLIRTGDTELVLGLPCVACSPNLLLFKCVALFLLLMLYAFYLSSIKNLYIWSIE